MSFKLLGANCVCVFCDVVFNGLLVCVCALNDCFVLFIVLGAFWGLGWLWDCVFKISVAFCYSLLGRFRV